MGAGIDVRREADSTNDDRAASHGGTREAGTVLTS
jgi:hypothetical protein